MITIFYSLPNTQPSWEQDEVEDILNFKTSLQEGGQFINCNCCGTRRLTGEFYAAIVDINDPLLHPLARSLDAMPLLVADVTNGIRLCKRCYRSLKDHTLPKFAAANNMVFGEPPVELTRLSEVELSLISRVSAFVEVHRLTGGAQWGTSSNIANFYNNITEVLSKLPRSIDSINTIYVRVAHTNPRQHLIRPTYIRAALHWLKANNPLYADVIIDEAAVQALYEARPAEVILDDDIVCIVTIQ